MDAASFRTVGGAVGEVSAVTNALNAAGATTPVGGPISDAVTFGLSGGFGFMYAVFVYGDQPTLAIVGRRASMPDAFFAPLFEEVSATVKTTGSAAAARKHLAAALDSGNQALCTVGALGYQQSQSDAPSMAPSIVRVIGSDADTVKIDDRSPQPWTVTHDELASARASYRAAKHRCVSVGDLGDGRLQWAELLPRALERFVVGFDTPPVPQFASNVGHAGRNKFAALLTDTSKKGWNQIFDTDAKRALALSRLYDCVCYDYASPGNSRLLYAEFLNEISTWPSTDIPVAVLAEASALASEAGKGWEQVARICRDANAGLGAICDLADAYHRALCSGEHAAELWDEHQKELGSCSVSQSEAMSAFEAIAELVSALGGPERRLQQLLSMA